MVFGSVATDANGQFSLQNVPADNWSISAAGPGGLVSINYAGHQSGGIYSDVCNLGLWNWGFSRSFSTGAQEDANFVIITAQMGQGFEITQPTEGSTFSPMVVTWTPLPDAARYILRATDLSDSTKYISADNLKDTIYDPQKQQLDPSLPGHCYLIAVLAVTSRSGPIAIDTVQACRQ